MPCYLAADSAFGRYSNADNCDRPRGCLSGGAALSDGLFRISAFPPIRPPARGEITRLIFQYAGFAPRPTARPRIFCRAEAGACTRGGTNSGRSGQCAEDPSAGNGVASRTPDVPESWNWMGEKTMPAAGTAAPCYGVAPLTSATCWASNTFPESRSVKRTTSVILEFRGLRSGSQGAFSV